jgi:Uma2 family endonuclease
MSEVKTQAGVEGSSSDVMPARRLFTVREYHRMVKAGILREDDRVELVNGEILLMAPIGSRHMACVNNFTERFVLGLAGRAIVSVQNSVRLSSGSEPQPDLALLRPRRDRYEYAVPGPEDVFLLVEVSDTTRTYDRETKLPLYAEAGIPEVWVADLPTRSILIARDPSEEAYRHVETVARSGTVSPAAFSDLVVQVRELVG